MSDVTVKTATLELRTAKLNKSILKQMRRITYEVEQQRERSPA